MGKEAVESEINLQGENSVPAKDEPENLYGWRDYYQSLLQKLGEVGEPSKEGENALREFYEGRREIEQQWYRGEIESPEERSDKKFTHAREFGKKHDALFDRDKAFSEAIAIIRDETG